MRIAKEQLEFSEPFYSSCIEVLIYTFVFMHLNLIQFGKANAFYTENIAIDRKDDTVY